VCIFIIFFNIFDILPSAICVSNEQMVMSFPLQSGKGVNPMENVSNYRHKETLTVSAVRVLLFYSYLKE